MDPIPAAQVGNVLASELNKQAIAQASRRRKIHDQPV